MGQTSGRLCDSGDFVSLDSKLSLAISAVIQGDVSQDIYNRTEQMARAGLMITGRQQHFLALGHLEYDRDHSSTHNILSITNLRCDGDSKLAYFLRNYDMVINGLSGPIAETILRLQLYDKLKSSHLLQHVVAWFNRAADPFDPNHGTVYTHNWLLGVIRNRVKSMGLESNTESILKNLNSVPSTTFGAVGVLEHGGNSNQGGANTAPPPPGGAGKGKGQRQKQRPFRFPQTSL